MKNSKQSEDKQRKRHGVKGGTTRLRKTQTIVNGSQSNIESLPIIAEISGNGWSVLKPTTGQLKVPEALIEASGSQTHGLLPGLVMSTIIIFALVFICVIAWFVSQMPDK